MKKLVILVSLVFLGAGCGTTTLPTTNQANTNSAAEKILNSSQTGIANPASVNCAQKGGTLQIETRGDGGQFGVCYFEDNRQCEEWALFRGECPVGGLKVTGYITDAARYCAITGGTYTITDEKANPEQGMCKLSGGTTCDVWNFYNGTCDQNSNQ